jgi:hypothetical protein
MATPIRPGNAPFDYSITDGERAALDYCRKADSVTSGFICGEPQVVSDACRTPKSALDKFVCDDPKMKQAQETALEVAWGVVKRFLMSPLGRY